LPSGLVSLSALRRISPRAADILDRISADQTMWVPATMFSQFLHTLCWGNFADLDLDLLQRLDAEDRHALLEELRHYHQYLRCQRERVDRFHHAYREWLDGREREIPRECVGRLRHWRQRFGDLAYFRITGLATGSGFQKFMTDPAGHMARFERAFAELTQQQAEFRQSGVDDGWFFAGHGGERACWSTQIERALSFLGLPATASLTEIRQAYRQRAKMLHPDWQGEKHESQMVALNGAYELLRTYRRSATAVEGTGQ
jgi:hypothetical protein